MSYIRLTNPWAVLSIMLCALFSAAMIDRRLLMSDLEDAARRHASDSARVARLDDSVRAAWNQSMTLVCRAEDPRTKDFFIFWRIGNGASVSYSYATTLDVDRDDLDYVIRYTVNNEVPLWFTISTLWRESRLGVNTAHKPNRDGSRDGGWFGINSRVKPPRKIVNPREDAADFVAYFNDHIRQFPSHEWHVRYRFGETRARKLGLLFMGRP